MTKKPYKDTIRKSVGNGSKILNTEPKLKMFLNSALKTIDHKYEHYKYYVVFTENPDWSLLDFPKWSHIVIIRWEEQWILCCDSVIEIRKWLASQNIEPLCTIQEIHKNITRRHKHGTYRQYSNHTLGVRREPGTGCYDPLLEHAQDLLDRYNITIGHDHHTTRKKRLTNTE